MGGLLYSHLNSEVCIATSIIVFSAVKLSLTRKFFIKIFKMLEDMRTKPRSANAKGNFVLDE